MRATSEPSVAPKCASGPVLADGRTGPERHHARQRGQEAGACRNPAVQPLDGADDVGGAVGTPLGDEAVQDSDDESAERRHADGGRAAAAVCRPP